MIVEEMMQKIIDSNNWTDDFFKEIEPIYLQHFNTVRNTLTQKEIWEKFDTAFSEWKRPGQVKAQRQVSPTEKGEIVACDAGKTKVINLESESLNLVSMDAVEEREPDWLIANYIPKYQITVMAGDGGSGKTTSWCGIAAAVSSGTPSFLENVVPEEFVTYQPQKVLFFSSEDSFEYTLKARLRKNGGSMGNIYSISLKDERFSEVKFKIP